MPKDRLKNNTASSSIAWLQSVHLEACPDLNTDTFFNAYRRFVSRRRQPTTMLSDNGKRFIGASEKLKRCVKRLDNDKFYKAMAATNTTCKFNPLYGPHFGGIWELLMQTAKRTLLIILGSRRLSLDVFRTILVKTEAILNSRPLTIVADLPENEMPLTPNNFLINRPFNSLPTEKFDSHDPASFKSWKISGNDSSRSFFRHLKRSKWSDSD